MRVGIIGCGNISETYFECQNLFNNFNVVACADINIEAAKRSAEKYNVKAFSVDDILANDDIDVIINLTIPSAHKEIIMKSLNAGKHCFSEKPLAMNFNEGLEISELASSKNLYVGCAPDTFLGAAGQKARSLIEDKKIGDVVLGTFNLMSHGMEHWHPNPDFFFKPGAGPVFDVGVYYITQLVNLIGPIKSISSLSGTATPERTITSEPRNGEKIKVETPTTLMGALEFHNNAKIQFFCSWDVWKHKHSTIELYGLKGSMIVPDPNFFSGDILISQKEEDWQVINNDKMLLGIPNKTDNNGDKIANYRGIGLSDMINAISNKRQSRCSLDLAVHVLEAMEGIIRSSDERVIYNMKTKPHQPVFLDDSEVVKLKK
ncbi:Gfo/Idh/MocA family oxidoreductase [Alphaproteobacteria bacterium]|nr:Gfo/Idh/MocA family oxidoreductase [Alphaproteobacteria bacterium]